MDRDERQINISLAVYDAAQETAHHSDSVIWEVVSIIWGANTLLLGFILEAMDKRAAQPLIMVVSVLGVLVTVFVARVFYVGKIGQHIAFRICQDIERAFPENLRQHTKIEQVYPKGTATHWVYGITVLFILVWVATSFRTAYLYFCNSAQH